MATRTFTFPEAERLLPEVRRLTERAREQIDTLRDQLGGGATDADLEAGAGPILRGWAQSVQELGVEVKGLWLVDFDNGSGYYCWKWPEPSLRFFHTYEEGFGGRVPIQ